MTGPLVAFVGDAVPPDARTRAEPLTAIGLLFSRLAAGIGGYTVRALLGRLRRVPALTVEPSLSATRSTRTILSDRGVRGRRQGRSRYACEYESTDASLSHRSKEHETQ